MAFGFEEFLASSQHLKLSPMTIACCRYLERTGRHFFSDFGYDNAEKIAWDELETEAAKAEWEEYVFDRSGNRIATLAVPTANTIPSASATIPTAPGGLNAKDYSIDCDNASDGVDASYIRP